MKIDFKHKNTIVKIAALICVYIVAGVLFTYFEIPLTRGNLLLYGILMFGFWALLNQIVNIVKIINSGKVSEAKKVVVKQGSWGQRLLRLVAAVFLALIGCRYLSLELNANSAILLLFLIYSFYVLLEDLKSQYEKKEIVGTLLISILWSCATVIGEKIDLYNKVFSNGFEASDIIRIIAFSAMGYVVFSGFIKLLIRNEVKQKMNGCFNRKRFISGALFMILCWSPYFLTYFPGNLSSDSYSSIAQVIGGETLNNHHPVMFTVLVGICIKVGFLFGGLEAGIAVFSILQMVILALTLSYCLEWMKEKGIQSIVRVGALLFFAFSPLIGMYSVTMWKDILFSCWVLLLAMVLYDIVSDDNSSCIIKPFILLKIALLCVFIAFGRNNGIYIVLAVLLALIIYGRKMWKRLVPIFGAILAFILLIQGPVYNALNIQKGSFAEAVGIPLQQIAYTVKYEGNVNDEQKHFLEQIIPLEDMKKAYDPTISNGIKFHENFDDEFLEAHKKEFLKVWAQMLLNNPADYIKAYCMQTMGFWHVDTIGYTFAYGADDYWIHINSTNVIGEMLGIDLTDLIQNKLPVLYNTVPFVNLFFSTAAPAWFLFTGFLILVIQKRSRMLISLIPLIVLWGTIMIATPTHGEFRYVFCLNLAIPFITTVILSSKERKEEKAERNKNYGENSSFNPMLQ